MTLARANDEFLGNEEALERLLGASKPTVRQAARVLEREGLLRVRRGNNGGYFCARPDASFIEATVASYLEVLQASPEDLTHVATALWVETVRKATALRDERLLKLVARGQRALERLPRDASFSAIQKFEHKIRAELFTLLESPYVELIFNINANFARRRFATSPAGEDDASSHALFVEAWRRATRLELDAIAAGDEQIAVLAANRARAEMHRRIWGK
ncbi:GntR family transcriptional regulator [Novosphingobium sp. JCM 18896]|uniref:GntR family transcriptional regulator n=1 Tax=Novosphingobium sp. JCM 18896 TaxID=2989731 RepID=UPI0022238E12|nr:GntR family transcriptional regulator [Novosphingobium sp. JCM 18896]MCW1431644.1 GntR family transcriptional regulator [Novosphingobium sp. JCM 18896]